MTGHKIKLDKREVDIKDGKLVRKSTFRSGIKRRVAEARAAKEAEAWAKKKPPVETEGR